MKLELTLRFDYGSVVPWITRRDGNTLQAVCGPDMVVLRSAVELKPEGFRHHATFDVSAGQDVAFSLGYGPSFCPLPRPINVKRALETTARSWKEWAEQRCDFGPYSEAAKRSLIALKALTYRPTGGIVAAPTTSLPEALGGNRNWDYRYCWLRDATFTLMALMASGYHHEAAAWRGWLRRAVAGDPAQVQIMYRARGRAAPCRMDRALAPRV